MVVDSSYHPYSYLIEFYRERFKNGLAEKFESN